MFYITLISAQNDALNKTPEHLCLLWSGKNLKWLCADQAAEFTVQSAPRDFEQIWADLQKERIDIALHKGPRPKKILLADMDSTMIAQECIDELAAAAGVGAQVADITKRAMNGEMNFKEALNARVKVLKDLPVTIIEKVYQQRITLMPGAKVLLNTMKANGAYTALVSGGFTDFTARIAQQLGFDEHRANRLLQSNGKLTGKVGLPILGQTAKLDALSDISARLKLSAEDVLAVGDGANDLAMIKAAGMGVALHAKPVVQKQAALRINHSDLSALLYLQGYSKEDFIE